MLTCRPSGTWRRISLALGVGKADTVQLNTAGCPGLTFSLVNSTIRGLVTVNDKGRASALQDK